MTGIQAIIVVLIRLWAASAIVNALIMVPVYAGLVWNDTPDRSSAIQFAIFGVWLILGVVAWFIAPWISRRVINTNETSGLRFDTDAETLVAIGGFLIGIFYLAQYLPPILIDWARWLIQRAGETASEQAQHGTGQRSIVQWQNFISNCSIVVVASFMTFRPSYLARIFNWLRTAGHEKLEKAEE